MQKRIDIHGVPMDLGVDLRGVDMGPSAFRIAGLANALEGLGHDVTDHGDIQIHSRTSLKKDESNARYQNEIAKVCERLANIAVDAKTNDIIPIFVGGDHSIAAGTISGISRFYQQQKKQDIGLIWFDAHADMNTPETSPSGNVHGMPLAALLGQSSPSLLKVTQVAPIKPENVHLIGIRDLDSQEREALSSSGINVYSMKEVDILGMAEVTKRAITEAKKNTAGIHLSFDIDGLDPALAPGVGTPVRGGINFREAHLFMEMIADSQSLLSMDIVELNPIRDNKNKTAQVLVELVESAFGKRITK